VSSSTSRLTFELFGRDNASPVFDKFGRRVDQTRDRVGLLDRASRNLGPTLAALGLAKMATDSVKLEAAYSRTMAQVGVATGEAGKKLESLDDLAMKLGADTTFSAQDAGTAMLELAKGGLSAADIKAGSLANTLTLATAGGLELGDAANVVVQAMGAFGLSAKDTGSAVAALAGAANASSADVSDITQALAQAGTTANAAGLSIQDTTAFLAMFADKGIQGSDAGTALKTMLTRLVPSTKAAADTMAELGLSYTDANGQMVSAEEIASRTREAFKGLTDEERTRAINTIFGSDAQRAANVLIGEGEKGLKRYKTATSDLSQAEKLAKASTSGTAGALEQLSGAYETAQIQVGKGLAPAVEDLANKASDMVADGDFEEFGKKAGDVLTDLGDIVIPLAESTFPAMATAVDVTADAVGVLAPAVRELADAFNAMPQWAQTVLVAGGAAKMLGVKLPGGAGGGVAGAAASTAAGAAAGRAAAGRTAGQAAAAAGGTVAGRVGGVTLGRAAGIVGIANVLGTYYNEKMLDSVQNAQEKARRGTKLTNDEMREQARLSKEIFGDTKRRSGGGTFDKVESQAEKLTRSLQGTRDASDDVWSGLERVGDAEARPDVKPRGIARALGELADVGSSVGRLDKKDARPAVRPSGIGGALQGLADVGGRLSSIDGRVATAQVRIGGIGGALASLSQVGDRIAAVAAQAASAGGRRATGGAILGGGSGTSDDVLIWASNGEHMLDADDVKALGGQSGAYEFRRRLHEDGGTTPTRRASAPAARQTAPPAGVSDALLRQLIVETQRTNQLLQQGRQKDMRLMGLGG
jgi:TP901 family phage tail tape measure protein